MKHTRSRPRSSQALPLPWLRTLVCGTIAVTVAASSGCRQLTGIDAPDLVAPSSLDNATGAAARYAGAIGDFAAAYTEQVLETGLLTDEFQDVGDNAYSSDRRVISSVNNYPFADLSRARISGLRAITTLRRFAPSPPQRIGELYALAGFIEVMLGENVCAPIPLATLVDGLPAAAPPLGRDALIDDALSLFDSAAEYSGGTDTVSNLARLGRARALLLRGDVQAAAGAALGVPEEFKYSIPYSASIAEQGNNVYTRTAILRSMSVSDGEGLNGLPFVSGTDSRIGADSLGLSRSNHPLFNFAKDGGLGAPVVLASGVEAALTRAEAALSSGKIDEWAGILNALRLTAISPAVAPLPDDSTVDASPELQVDVLFHERAFWLFGTGHRQGDLLRLIRQYGRLPESTFPTGDYEPTPGVTYGTSTLFVPSGEEQNLDYHGCTGGEG